MAEHITRLHNTPLEDAQREIEKEMKDRGVQKFRDNWNRVVESGTVGTSHTVGSMIATQFYEKGAAGIKEWVERAKAGRPGKNAAYAVAFDGLHLDYASAAYLVISTVVSGIFSNDKRNHIATTLASHLKTQWAVGGIIKADEDVYIYVDKDMKKKRQTSRRKKAGRIKDLGKKRGIRVGTLNNKAALQLGAALLAVVSQATGFFTFEKRKVSKTKVIDHIVPDPRLIEWVRRGMGRLELNAQTYLPMVVPPRKWTDGQGGYLTLDESWIKAETDQMIPAQVATALDALGSTPFRVNTYILNVAETLKSSGDAYDVLGTRFREMPPKPPKDAPKSVHDENRATYAAVNAHNRDAANKTLLFEQTLKQAHKYAQYDEIFFPHQLDFRGRAYPMSTMLSPQGPDEIRSLIEFAVGKPVEGPVASRWHCVAGANAFGYDKASYADREEWVLKHHRQIMGCAENPFIEGFWRKADSPLTFLAWCYDYARVRRGGLSHCRVSLDGTANGLQHYTALMRDEKTAPHVNLIRGEAPSDIYATVADAVSKELRDFIRDYQEGEHTDGKRYDWARTMVAYKMLDRKMCKHTVMTMFYGGTIEGTRKSVRKELIAQNHHLVFGTDFMPASAFLANMVYDAASRVANRAKEAMRFLQTFAKEASGVNQNMHWKSPCGLLVTSKYNKMEVRRIFVPALDVRKRLRVTDYKPTDEVDGISARQSIAANFVHSLDASAMFDTMGRCLEKGITSFHMVHDDYSTHAADTEELSNQLREAFVEMYTNNDPLQDLLDGMEYLNRSALLPEIPARGSFNIRDVLYSPYFFN